MDNAMLAVIGQFGIVPTMLLLIMVVWFLLREIKKEISGLSGKIDSLAKHSDARDKELRTAIEAVEERSDTRLRAVEEQRAEYLARDDYYRDMSGWREELRSMRNDLTSLVHRELKEMRGCHHEAK